MALDGGCREMVNSCFEDWEGRIWKTVEGISTGGKKRNKCVEVSSGSGFRQFHEEGFLVDCVYCRYLWVVGQSMENAEGARPKMRWKKKENTDFSVMAKWKTQRLCFLVRDSNDLESRGFHGIKRDSNPQTTSQTKVYKLRTDWTSLNLESSAFKMHDVIIIVIISVNQQISSFCG